MRHQLARLVGMTERHPNPEQSFDVGVAIGCGLTLGSSELSRVAAETSLQLDSYLEKLTVPSSSGSAAYTPFAPVVKNILLLGKYSEAPLRNAESELMHARMKNAQILSRSMTTLKFDGSRHPIDFARITDKFMRAYRWRSALVFVDTLSAYNLDNAFALTLADGQRQAFICPTFGSQYTSHALPNQSLLATYIAAAYYKSSAARTTSETV